MTVYVSLGNEVKVQAPVGPEATNVQVKTDEVSTPVAVIVTAVSVSRPDKLNVGVEFEVMLSVEDEPVSDAAARSGAFGVGGVIETVPELTGERLPLISTV